MDFDLDIVNHAEEEEVWTKMRREGRGHQQCYVKHPFLSLPSLVSSCNDGSKYCWWCKQKQYWFKSTRVAIIGQGKSSNNANTSSLRVHLKKQGGEKPVWVCILLCESFEDAFENTQWGEFEQMQPLWICLLWPLCVMDTFENTHRRKKVTMRPFRQAIWGDISKHTVEKRQTNVQPVW